MSLGRIIVDLLARTGSFETDLNRASKLADKRAREIDAAFKRAGHAVGLIMAGVATTTAAAIKSSIDRMDELSKAAQRVQMPTEQFSALAYAAGLADVSTEDLQGALGKLSKAMGDAQRSTSVQSKLFKALGIEVEDSTGKMRGSLDVLLDFADAFRDGNGSTELMAAGMNIFERSFQKLIPLLKDGSVGVKELMEEARRLGIVVSTEAGQQAEEFNDNLSRLKAAAQGLAMAVTNDLMPDLLRMSESMVGAADNGERLRDTAERIANVIRGVGSAFGWVYDRTQELAIGIGFLTEAAAANLAILKQVATFGMANGTIGEALARVRNARDVAKESVKDVRTPWKPTIAPLFAGAGQDDPDWLFKYAADDPGGIKAEAARRKAAREREAAIRKALGDPDPKGKKGGGAKKSGKSDADREAEQLLASYARVAESLKEQTALIGAKTEAQRINYDVTEGGLAKLEPQQKAELLRLAALKDAAAKRYELEQEGKALIESLLSPMERVNKLHEKYQELLAAGEISQDQYNKAIERAKTPAQEMIEDMKFELHLLTLSNKEREKAIAQRWAGVEAMSAEGQEIGRLMDAMARMREADAFRQHFENSMADAFYDFATGAKSAKDALKDFFDSLAQYITRMIAENWAKSIADIFAGGNSGGTNMFSAAMSIFGGGRASGGPVGSGTTYLVGERGPELFVPRTAGTIIPAGMTAQLAGGGGGGVNQNFYVQGVIDGRTQRQLQQGAARAGRQALARNGA